MEVITLLFGAIASAMGLYVKGRVDQNNRQKMKVLKQNEKTRKRINEASISKTRDEALKNMERKLDG